MLVATPTVVTMSSDRGETRRGERIRSTTVRGSTASRRMLALAHAATDDRPRGSVVRGAAGSRIARSKPMTTKPSRALVAVIGDGGVSPESPRYLLAEAIGRGLVDAGHRVVTGGLGGVMEAACRGARRSSAWTEGTILGVLPGSDPSAANEFVDVALCTGLGHGRNRVVAQADAVIAVGGGAGTLSELAFAWIHGRLVIGLRCGGWSERLADERIDERVRYEDLPGDRVYGATTADAALRLLDELLPRYRRRP